MIQINVYVIYYTYSHTKTNKQTYFLRRLCRETAMPSSGSAIKEHNAFLYAPMILCKHLHPVKISRIFTSVIQTSLL
jgi:hypothetical protein